MIVTSPSSLFFATPRSRTELDADYSPSRFIDNLGKVIDDWRNRTATSQAAHAGRLSADLAYGPHPRERFDLYRSEARHAPLLVFIHGGFWRAVSKDESGFIADAWTQQGVHVAVMDYALAPEVTLSTIVDQIRRGLAWLQAEAPRLGFDASRMVISGHSAGAQLAAMSRIATPSVPVISVAGLVLVSGVFELAPLSGCYVNDALNMTETEISTLSPVRLRPATPRPIVMAVGENEPVAFHEQTRHFAWTWRDHGPVREPLLVPRRNHFDILDDLADPRSELGRKVSQLLSGDPLHEKRD